MGDKRVYGYIIVLRAVTTTDFMTAEACEFLLVGEGWWKRERLIGVVEFPWSFLQRVMTRIINEVHGYVFCLSMRHSLLSSLQTSLPDPPSYPSRSLSSINSTNSLTASAASPTTSRASHQERLSSSDHSTRVYRGKIFFLEWDAKNRGEAKVGVGVGREEPLSVLRERFRAKNISSALQG